MYETFAHSCSEKFPCRGNASVVDIKHSGKICKEFSEHLFIYSSNMPQYLSRNKERELIEIAAMLMSKGKGLLSADESTAAMSKYLQPLALENNEENRRLYRQVLFTASKDLSNYIAGIVLFHETFYQTDDHGKPFREILIENGIIPGIKVDKGLVLLAGTNGENTTQGLDGLTERCIRYYQDGARFAQWRCLVKIGDDRPSEFCLREISNVLGRYASICQQNGLLPILEIEISSEGDHDLKTSQFITEKVFAALFKSLNDHQVFLEGIILQSNIVLAGLDCKEKYTPEEIAQATVTAFQRTIPPAVPGICFLLTGQSEEKASIYLNTIHQYPSKKPWVLTFNYGRKLLQSYMLETWNGRVENVRHAQEQLLKRMQAHSAAASGEFQAEHRSSHETNGNH